VFIRMRQPGSDPWKRCAVKVIERNSMFARSAHPGISKAMLYNRRWRSSLLDDWHGLGHSTAWWAADLPNGPMLRSIEHCARSHQPHRLFPLTTT